MEENVESLKRIKKTEGLANVTILHQGVWKYEGKVKFMVDKGMKVENKNKEIVDESTAFHNNKVKEASTFIDKKTKEYNVKYEESDLDVDTLDNIISDFSIPIPDHIHITVTGCEYEILLGMEKLLNQDIRLMVSSSFLSKDFDCPNSEVIRDFLLRRNFC